MAYICDVSVHTTECRDRKETVKRKISPVRVTFPMYRDVGGFCKDGVRVGVASVGRGVGATSSSSPSPVMDVGRTCRNPVGPWIAAVVPGCF